MNSNPSITLANELYRRLAQLEAAVRRDQAEATKIRELLGLMTRSGQLGAVTVSATGFTSGAETPLPLRQYVTATVDAVIVKGTPSKKDQIRAAVEKHLKQNGPTHRKAILEYLTRLNLMGTEKSPLKALAIYLSEFDAIESDGNGNWGIKGTLPIPDEKRLPQGEP